jgi:DNA-binding CsgD family transcriptional regulator
MKTKSSLDVESLIAELYEAAIDDNRWPRFLQRLADGLSATSASLIAIHSPTRHVAVSATVNQDPEFAAVYERHFHASDVWAIAGRKLGMFAGGSVNTSQSAVPVAELLKTEFGNDFALRFGLVHGMTGIAAADSERLAAVNLYRDANCEPFDRAEVVLVRHVIPHVQRALRIHDKWYGIQAHGLALGDAIERFSGGVVLADRHASVAWMNTTAERLIKEEDGLRVRGKKLEAQTPDETRRLREIIRAASHGHAVSDAALTVSRRSDKRAYVILVHKLPRHDSSPLTLLRTFRRAEAVVFIDDPATLHIQPQRFRELYRFTPAEARLAAALLTGDPLDSIADKLGVRLNTVRSQLKSLFSKTHTRRQAELIRVLMTASRP